MDTLGTHQKLRRRLRTVENQCESLQRANDRLQGFLDESHRELARLRETVSLRDEQIARLEESVANSTPFID